MPKTKLFITDLDGTLAGDAAVLGQFKTFLRSFERPPQLVYVTGRHLQSALQLIAEDELPQPELLVTDIGTAIYVGAEEDTAWKQRMHEQWRPDAIAAIGTEIEGLTQQDLPNTRRVSFTTNDEHSVAKFAQQLADQQISHKLIYSAGRYVDVLPQGSGKGQAVSYVLDTYYAHKPQVLIAGDSGNDAEMLELGYPSVIVGNGLPELNYLHDRPTVYPARQKYAAGIQEGWEHFYASTAVQAGT